MNNSLKKILILIIISFLYLVIVSERAFCACADLDGDGIAETCIGGSSGYKTPTPAPSLPGKVNTNRSSSSQTQSHHSSHSSSFKKNWDAVDDMTTDVVNSIIRQQKQKEREKQELIEKQKLQAELKKKQDEIDAVKRKIEEEKKQKILAKQRDKNNQWLKSLENKSDQKPAATQDNNISGMVKLLRNPDNLNMMNPDSDIRTSDLYHIKLKNQLDKNKNPQDKVSPAYYGPDPKSLTSQELQYQIKLLDMQISQCDAGGSSACSAQFLNMLVKEKEKYVCEKMARGPVSSLNQPANNSVLSKVKRFDSVNDTNQSNNSLQNAVKTNDQSNNLNLHGSYAVNK